VGLASSRGDQFYLFEDRTDKAEVVGLDVLTEDGHCTVLPDKRWMLNDTYLTKIASSILIYSILKRVCVILWGIFILPEYKGDLRCDNHPRFSPDGRKVVIDSTHGGNGRQMYLIDIPKLLEFDETGSGRVERRSPAPKFRDDLMRGIGPASRTPNPFDQLKSRAELVEEH